MSQYWHATKMEHVPSIRKSGLAPGIGENSESFGEPTPRVYMFTSREDLDAALSSWLGQLFDDAEEIALLHITIPDELKPFCEGTDGFECEVTCTKAIPANCIEFFDEMYQPLENE